jgi:hypothetical protein
VITGLARVRTPFDAPGNARESLPVCILTDDRPHGFPSVRVHCSLMFRRFYEALAIWLAMRNSTMASPARVDTVIVLEELLRLSEIGLR